MLLREISYYLLGMVATNSISTAVPGARSTWTHVRDRALSLKVSDPIRFRYFSLTSSLVRYTVAFTTFLKELTASSNVFPSFVDRDRVG